MKKKKVVLLIAMFCMGLSLTGYGSDLSAESSSAASETTTEGTIQADYVHLITDREIEIGTPEAVNQEAAETEI